MRQAGTLPSKNDAQRFVDYLLTLGIGAKVEPAADQWALWILDENQVPRSKQELEQYLLAPDAARYVDAASDARTARREAAQRVRQAQKNFVDVREQWSRPGRAKVTMVMIGISVLLGLLTQLGNNLGEVGDALMFSMRDIEEGQVWRLITPIFLHGGPLHLLFNMWWLYDLGNLIERQAGWWRFALMVLGIALVSNFSQYLATGPNFVGMSGVVFGLFGYAWIRGRLDPTCGLYLRPDVVMMMLIWLAVCSLNMVGNVANWAHGVGIASGVVIGYLVHTTKIMRRHT